MVEAPAPSVRAPVGSVRRPLQRCTIIFWQAAFLIGLFFHGTSKFRRDTRRLPLRLSRKFSYHTPQKTLSNETFHGKKSGTAAYLSEFANPTAICRLE